MAPKKPKTRLSKRRILEFIKESPTPVGKREIARAFNIKGGARIALKAILKELRDEGVLDSGRKRRVRSAGQPPPVLVVEIVGTDDDGEVLCRPVNWDGEAPVIYLNQSGSKVAAPGAGDRVLVRLKKTGAAVYEAEIIRVLGPEPNVLVGVYQTQGANGIIRPTSRGRRPDIKVAAEHRNGARDGDVVAVELLPGPRGASSRAKIVERLGPISDPKTYSIIAIHGKEIPTEFTAEALAQAEAAAAIEQGQRTDLRDLPLVTIDGPDARDYDDAVWAAPDDKNPGGWIILIAIADVAWYVRPGDALDHCASERGTSAYFPDRVVPMLPEALSNGLCSLIPGEDRPCLAARIHIDAGGEIQRHEFIRAIMRSAARLTYDQVQRAQDGAPDSETAPLAADVIAPLYGAFEALSRGRARRGTLDLELPELEIFLGEDGQVGKIEPKPRLDSHRLIEEFMIAANVAAAESLEKKGAPVMYRVHEPPSLEKLEALRQSLGSLGYKLARSGTVRPAHLAGILRKASEAGHTILVNGLVLRSQSKAVYGPNNLGHFGLALQRYCHFTSPIRRYPDILVHRALIAAHRLGEGGLPADMAERFEEIGEQVSTTERRAEAAEREARGRYITAFLADRVGAHFPGRISGVTRFGLFVTLDNIGADGLIPIRTLPQDYYDHDESQNRLVGRDSGRAYSMGEAVVVALGEANINTGGLVFEIVEGGAQIDKRHRAKRGGPRGRRRKIGRPRR